MKTMTKLLLVSGVMTVGIYLLSWTPVATATVTTNYTTCPSLTSNQACVTGTLYSIIEEQSYLDSTSPTNVPVCVGWVYASNGQGQCNKVYNSGNGPVSPSGDIVGFWSNLSTQTTNSYHVHYTFVWN